MLTSQADGSPRRERRRRSTCVTPWFGLIAGPAIVGLLSLAGCASGTTSDASATTSPTPTAVSADGDVSGLIDIGNGRNLYLECRGTGSPTVVFISGLTGAHDQWQYSRPASDPAAEPTENDQAVFPAAARSTRVCAYDRPNTIGAGAPGRSTPVAQPTTSAVDAADLHALLIAAGVPGPYVLVGQSFGGLIATAYARTYPDDVVGLVLVDPLSQFFETALGPAAWERYVYLISTASESKDLVAGNAALDDLPPLPPIPVVVLSSDRTWLKLPTDPATFEELAAGNVPTVDSQNAWDEAQALLAGSLGATHITQTNSGHEIEIENAPLVNQQICAVIGPAVGC